MTDERRYKPDFDTPCPWVPEGATDWETQEITFRWRSALGYIDSARHILVDYAERLVREGAYEGVSLPDNGQWATGDHVEIRHIDQEPTDD